MSDPIDFNARLATKRATSGEFAFLICTCQADADPQEGFFPVVLHDATGALVVSLVCGGCRQEVALLGGRPQQ